MAQEETLKSNRYVCGLDGGNGFTVVFLFPKTSGCTD